MHWRGIKKSGYTLVELVVVLGVISLILLISFGGYMGVREEKYVQHVANLTQTNVRDTFIDIVSTKVEGACGGRSPKIKALRITNGVGFNSVAKLSLCENPTTGQLEPPVAEAIDASSGINYKKNLEVFTRVVCSPAPCVESNAGYTYLIFTSPYGQYYSYYVAGGTAAEADNDFYMLGGGDVGWEKGDDQIYRPTAATLDKEIKIFFDSDTTALKGTVHEITISRTGNVKLD